MENDQILLAITNHILKSRPNLIETIDRILSDYNYDLKTNADLSFANERVILEKYVDDLNLSNGFIVDIAASDGSTQSCTLGLFSRNGWRGLAVECDGEKFSKLAKLYTRFKNCFLAKNFVTPNNIVNILEAFNVPREYSVLNLDIDSFDLEVLKKMLLAGFHPDIIAMEINEKIPTGVYFSVNYSEDHVWSGDHFFGCSIDAAYEAVSVHGYLLSHIEYNNAFFIRADKSQNKFDSLAPQEAFDRGYKLRSDRKMLFPWNDNVEHWLNYDADEAIHAINEYFKKYDGRYTIRKSRDISK